MTFYLKNLNKNKKSLTHSSYHFFEKRFYFCQEMLAFVQKCCLQQNLGSLATVKNISWNYIYVYVGTRFQASTIILARFEPWGEGLVLASPPHAITNPKNVHLDES